MTKRILLLLIIFIIAGIKIPAWGVCVSENFAANDTIASSDSIIHTETTRQSWYNRKIKPAFKSIARFFSPEFDSTYIESQKYNFTVMALCERNDDHFILSSTDKKEGASYYIDMAPKSSVQFGPYFGWRWLFYGYTFNLSTIKLNNSGIDINFNIYTPSLGIDLIYRDLGDNYRIRKMDTNNESITKSVEGLSVSGLDIDILGVKAFYIVNPKRYSHQAIFNQTNRQIKSAGSWLFGTGWYKNSISMDWDRFSSNINSNTNITLDHDFNDSTLFFRKIVYSSVPITAGYGYNWVFSRNWAAGAQVLGSVSYMWTYSDAKQTSFSLKKMINSMSFSNFALDGALRIGVVWNNSQWFAGVDAIYNTYNYRNKYLKVANIFGTINLYAGFNFWKRK